MPTEKEVLEILRKIKFDDIISSNGNLIDQGAVTKIIIKNNNVIFALDIGILGLNFEQGEILIARCKKQLEEIIRPEMLNIILTENKSTRKPLPANPQNKQSDSSSSNDASILPIIGVKNVIAVASGKGGVGKSTIAVNLALSLKKLGFKVGLVDADIYGPSIPHMMNLKGAPQVENNLMLPINNYGIDCISIGSLIDASQALIWRGPMITKTLYQLIRGVKWSDIDYLILDLPPGTGDVHLSMAQKFPITGVVIVSTPGEVAVIDAVKSIDMFKKLDIPILGVVQNMAYMLDEKGEKNYLFGQGGAENLAKKMQLNFLGDIELNIKIREAGDSKEPIAHLSPSSKIAFDYGRIAEGILIQIEK